MASLSASEIFWDSILNFLDDGEDEFTTSCKDEVDQILSSIPADIIEQVSNEPQPGPSSCVVDSETEKLKQKNWNKNTTRSTNTWVRRFERWYSQQPRQQARLEEIPVQELDRVLQEFYCHVRKQNGDEYEPDSLRTMLAVLDRHLSGCGCSYSIMKDREFRESRLVLNGKAIQLRENGKGKKSRKADPLTVEEEEILWNTRVLGGDNPKKDMAAMANLDTTNKKFTNHSIRKTTVCKLQIARISNDKIAAITGHKNEQSLCDYVSADLDDHRKLSNILLSVLPLSVLGHLSLN